MPVKKSPRKRVAKKIQEEPVLDSITEGLVDDEDEVVENSSVTVAEVKAPEEKVSAKLSKAPSSKKAYTKVMVLRDINPAPKIGTFDFRVELRLSQLKKGIYEIPHNVAEVMLDQGYAQKID